MTFSFGIIAIRWYSLAYIFGIVIGWWLGKKIVKNFLLNVDFKFDGEMQPDVALEEMYKELYPFSEIVGNSNVLIMPSQHSAAISYKMIKSMSRAKVIGPLLIGLGLPIEIAPLRSSTSDILNLASIAAYSADVIDYKKN